MVIWFYAAAAALQAASLHQQKKAAGLQQRLANNQAASERRQQIRDARRAAGQVSNAAALSGTVGSSSQISALGGINTQNAFNLSQSYITQGLSSGVSKANYRSNLFSGAANIIMQGNNEAGLTGLFQ